MVVHITDSYHKNDLVLITAESPFGFALLLVGTNFLACNIKYFHFYFHSLTVFS